MADRLNPNILKLLTKKLGKTDSQIRPRLSEIRRKYSGLTINAAAQIYAQSHGTSIMANLGPDDRKSLSTVQAISQQVNVSNVSKVDRRTLNIQNSPIHNLSFGDRNTVSQEVYVLDDELNKLSALIDENRLLTDDEKNDYKSDIQTVASQIGKSRPNRKIIKAAWESIKGLNTVVGFARSIESITKLIDQFT